MSSPLASAQYQLARVKTRVPSLQGEKKTSVWEKITAHESLYQTTLTVSIGGKPTKVKAFRSQHNSALGPYKGGVRFHPQVTAEEVQALSMWMTWKCALLGLPFGGAKGGMALDPRELSTPELEAVSRQYAAWLTKQEAIGPWLDVPAPDVNTTPQIMGWMLDEWQKISHSRLAAAFTGKPVILGGSQGRDEATGRGGALIAQAFVEKKNWDLSQTSVAVQGYGNVGKYFVSFAHEFGFKVVAVSDSSGTLVDPQGLSPATLDAYKQTHRSFAAAAKAKKLEILPPAAVLGISADLLVPAAMEAAITSQNAEAVKAKAVIEMANGPVTPEAESLLHERGVEVLPDILCNAGGVTVSYLEWVQNLHGAQWSLEQVRTDLHRRLLTAFAEVSAAQMTTTTWREAAYIRAVERVVQAEIARGSGE